MLMDKKNYEILSGDVLVAKWKNGNLEIINGALLPLFLKRIKNADMWLETRAIDSHRANSRLLKKALRLAEKDDISTVIHVKRAWKSTWHEYGNIRTRRKLRKIT